MKTTQQKIPKNTTQEITQEQKLGSLKAAENDFAKWLGGAIISRFVDGKSKSRA